ncbi:MAG: hypothetical protein COA58_14955 [Bacteroidetes bacterium]|nr:MAG: hypothetical protein COA58_14955 [Bacteroidota bacterium]
MKKSHYRWSQGACYLIIIVLVIFRLGYSEFGGKRPLKITTYDAFGYYMYLPAIFIYNDIDELKWLPEIDEKYDVTGGGKLYQANKFTNGNYVTKYLGGIAILEIPFFALGHAIASFSSYPADGFSAPYQWSLAFGALLYAFLSLLGLRYILLKFYDDQVVAVTLILLFLASNILQYISVDSAMSHSYILPMYVLLIHFTIKWHNEPKAIWAALIGLIMGVTVICRPTEALMLLVPLLWNTHNKEASKAKWALVKEYKGHIYALIIFGFLGVFPQLLYWKIETGSWVYDVGSKWAFLNPWFRVLFGWTNGWFIYTPVAILFIVGLFYIRNLPFRYTVITFCLLNIWVVMAWFDWRYGATYSTRALCQSYPVLALGLGALVQRGFKGHWRYVWSIGTVLLVGVNLFQITQYNSRVLIPNEITAYYYAGVYLDRNPTPLDMARLDNLEELGNPSDYIEKVLLEEGNQIITADSKAAAPLADLRLPENAKDAWLKVESSMKVDSGFYKAFIYAEVYGQDTVKYAKVRLFNPVAIQGEANAYAFFIHIPNEIKARSINIYTASEERLKGESLNLKVLYYSEK